MVMYANVPGPDDHGSTGECETCRVRCGDPLDWLGGGWLMAIGNSATGGGISEIAVADGMIRLVAVSARQAAVTLGMVGLITV